MSTDTSINPGKSLWRIPPTPAQRRRLREIIREYVTRESLVPPLGMDELRTHSLAIANGPQGSREYADWIMVALNNEVWRETVAAVPYERRILLLPQCLRAKTCPAKIDELGLVCEECGGCPIGELQNAAERLGYVVLVAEGTTVVTKLLQGGKVDAVVGISCMSVLERAFPHMAADAVPGIAIPLNHDGCLDTDMDLDWVWEAIRLKSDRPWPGRLDLDSLRTEVQTWFLPDQLRAILGSDGSATEQIAIVALGRNGKRWRPILAACVHRALDGADGPWPEVLKRAAVAVECFHKASLIHDDIEDDDRQRYGEPTVHIEHGVPIALNAGDFLLGQGYRLLATAAASPDQRVKMIAVAAEGHHTLCLGQGAELFWMRNPAPLSPQQVLRIFQQKTAPAFEVALRIGALAQGADDDICAVLSHYSRALGIAYQIRDDLQDYEAGNPGNDLRAMRPSLLLALAYEAAEGQTKALLTAAWQRAGSEAQEASLRSAIRTLRAEEKAHQLLEHYRNEAVRSLTPLRHVGIKSALRQILSRILSS